MACIGKPTNELKNLAIYTDATITWILEEHRRDKWLEKEIPDTKPQLRRYMRLVKQEAHKRGLLRT